MPRWKKFWFAEICCDTSIWMNAVLGLTDYLLEKFEGRENVVVIEKVLEREGTYSCIIINIFKQLTVQTDFL